MFDLAAIGVVVAVALVDRELAAPPPPPREVPEFDLAAIDEVLAERARKSLLMRRYCDGPLVWRRRNFSEEIRQSLDQIR